MNAPLLKFDARQSQVLTPRLQQAVRLLQMSSLEYAQTLSATADRNPFLDCEDGVLGAENPQDGDGEFAVPALTAAALATRDADRHEPEAGGVDDASFDTGADHDSWQALPHTGAVGRAGGDGDGEASAIDLATATVGLRDHLRTQANVLRLSERDRTLLLAMVESLDDDGYLRAGLDEVVELAGLDPAPDACELNTALRLLQSFEPAGVGATCLRECLLLQWNQRGAGAGMAGDLDIGRVIIERHLEALAHHDAVDIARRCGHPAPAVERVCAAIRRLNPRPGAAYAASDTQYIVPDVIVRQVRGRWKAQLNPAVVPRLRLNQTYAQILQRNRDSRYRELAGQLQEARWTLRNVNQRFSTILDVATAILRRQQRFFELGPFAMKPLGLREIAEECKLHESTVCRVTNNKYMATPTGVYELKYFFSRAMPMASGGACSPTAIRGLIQEIIAEEDASEPLSDVEIARRLSRQGLQIARRTVTKYRQLLKVPPVERRRRLPMAA